MSKLICFLAIAVCALQSGCAGKLFSNRTGAASDPIPSLADREEMQEELQERIPVGTPIEKAKSMLEKNGFACTYEPSGTFGKDSPAEMFRLVGQKEAQVGLWSSRSYSVTVGSNNGAVAAISVGGDATER